MLILRGCTIRKNNESGSGIILTVALPLPEKTAAFTSSFRFRSPGLKTTLTLTEFKTR